MVETRREKPLRLFAAVGLSEEARRAAAARAGLLRAESPPGVRVGWERVEKLHLTLKFFGDVERGRAPALSAALARAASGARAFTLSLEAAGVFPSPARPSVLWLGAADPSGGLARLHAHVEDECAAIGFARERRPFRPHVTLARLRFANSETRHIALRHLELAFEPVAFRVSEIVLMSSTLGPAGSAYTPLSRHQLGTAVG